MGDGLNPSSGSGVVGFNIAPQRALFCDNNPHIITFYSAINDGEITPGKTREFLVREGNKLARYGKAYYYEVRDRFNADQRPLDFLFLNRSCFNGMIRFNRQGGFNVPFGHKPHRFSKAYISKIVNQVEYVSKKAQVSEWEFRCQDFRDTLSASVTADDFVYCDPPYAGRHVDYFNGWDEPDERALYHLLNRCPAQFLLSTWHHNDFRENIYINTLWSQFHIVTREHFYHVGAKEANRNPMIEALVANFQPQSARFQQSQTPEQLLLLEHQLRYHV